MEPLELFSLLLLALAGTHLVFRISSLLSQLLAKGHRSSGMVTRERRAADRSSWYVFFDPEDLYGRRPPVLPGVNRQRTTGQQSPRPSVRRTRQTA